MTNFEQETPETRDFIDFSRLLLSSDARFPQPDDTRTSPNLRNHATATRRHDLYRTSGFFPGKPRPGNNCLWSQRDRAPRSRYGQGRRDDAARDRNLFARLERLVSRRRGFVSRRRRRRARRSASRQRQLAARFSITEEAVKRSLRFCAQKSVEPVTLSSPLPKNLGLAVSGSSVAPWMRFNLLAFRARRSMIFPRFLTNFNTGKYVFHVVPRRGKTSGWLSSLGRSDRSPRSSFVNRDWARFCGSPSELAPRSRTRNPTLAVSACDGVRHRARPCRAGRRRAPARPTRRCSECRCAS